VAVAAVGNLKPDRWQAERRPASSHKVPVNRTFLGQASDLWEPVLPALKISICTTDMPSALLWLLI